VLASIEHEKILPLLVPMGLTAYYIIKNRIAVIFEEKIDGQDIGYGVPLTA
jgi:hypothetical protein